MFCPKCGQERNSVEVRFCSRCGFHLGAVDTLLAQDAALVAQSATSIAGPPPRTLGMRLGAKLIFLSFILIPIFIGFAVLADSAGPLIVPFTIFLAGLFRLIYALLFEDRMAGLTLPTATNSALLPRHGAYTPPLPPHQSATLTPPSRRPFDTGEVAQPPSVTEHTTRFLEEK